MVANPVLPNARWPLRPPPSGLPLASAGAGGYELPAPVRIVPFRRGRPRGSY
jgi:hypothetical protein